MGVNDTLVFWGNSFVDGIMTDYPLRLTKVINELGVGD